MNDEAPKLTEPVGKEKKKKTLGDKIFFVIEIVLVTACAIMAGPITIMLVRNFGFGEVFFVNGASMYPTLNSTAYRPSDKRLLTWNDPRAREGDLLDYGWGKLVSRKENLWDEIRRYDIIMTYYPTDYTNGQLGANASVKIKRLIGFPGESVTITYDPERDPNEVFGYSVWGETTITGVDGKTFALPNLYSEKDYPDIPYGSGKLNYTSLGNPVDGNGEVYRSRTWTLGEDEYFVCGDNRRGSKSGDSRNFAANSMIKKHMVIGKAYLVTGKREYVEGTTLKFRLDQIYMPWNYINLEIHP